jgi:DNA ligase-1
MSTIPEFPKLFKINSHKKISEWEIKIVQKGSIYTIITSHGEENGKKVMHEKDITEGKVKRSVLEQAIQDAKRKWENKKEKELYSESLKESSNDNNITNKKIIVRPMLANTFSFDVYNKSRSFKISFPAYVQRKYDGIRCISYLKDDEVIIESRKGIPFQNFTLLKEELKNILKNLPENFYFDGELYTNELDFETISGLIRLHEKKITDKDIDLINKIDYHIYDLVDTNKLDLTYNDRYAMLKNIFFKNKTKRCKTVETIIIEELKDVKKYHDSFVKEGYEGIMVRDINGPYEINKRSKYLQKFKEFQEEEFKIIGYHEGTGDEKGIVIWDCKTKDGKPFAVRPKGTFESRKKLYDEGDKYVGKLLTVIFQEYSAENVPRFPVGKSIRDIY